MIKNYTQIVNVITATFTARTAPGLVFMLDAKGIPHPLLDDDPFVFKEFMAGLLNKACAAAASVTACWNCVGLRPPASNRIGLVTDWKSIKDRTARDVSQGR